MKDHILEILTQVEKDYDIKILYACEAGSRMWGTSSEESDYDVRFIYIHRMDWYLSIDQKRDVIEIQKHGKADIPINSQVDMSGWELTKALRLFRKSNPALIEWLHSNIIYYEDNILLTKMKQLEKTVFSPIPCMYHYVKMAKGNFKNIQEKKAQIKTYINVLRPLLMAKSIEKHNKITSLDLKELISNLLTRDELKKSIEELIKMKSSGRNITNQIVELNQFIEKEINHLEQYITQLESDNLDPTRKLDQLFRETLTDAWK